MVCQVQLNSIKYLENNGATDDVRRIINEDKFNELNDKLTKLAEQKYGLKTDGAKLFSVNMSEHVDPWRSTYYRDAKYRILRAEPNKPLFDRLQDLFNARPEQPMMFREEPVETEEKVTTDKETSIEEIHGMLFMDVNVEELQNERSREIAEVLAKRLSQSIGARFENVTPEEAANILKNRSVKYNGESAFYYAGTVYVVGDNVNVRTVLHRICSPGSSGTEKIQQHPISESLQSGTGYGGRSRYLLLRTQ